MCSIVFDCCAKGPWSSLGRTCRRRRCYHSPSATTITIRRGYGDREDGEGVVGILGATGTGKSRLSIDIGTRFPSEIVNSDKIQLYYGLDVTTNKMSMRDRKGVPHHLLGELHPSAPQYSPSGFRSLASARIDSIRSRRKLPIIAGGSVSFAHGLLAKSRESDAGGENIPLRYRCCLFWMDVGWEVLKQYLDRRVDEMVAMGMVEELELQFDRRRAVERRYRGLEMAIGVPELDKFFLRYPPEPGGRRMSRAGEKEGYEEAIEEIKSNTRILARRQAEKIGILRDACGWELRRLDATEAVRRKIEGRGKEEVEEAWERDVMGPAVTDVERFIMGRRKWWWGMTETMTGEVTVGGGSLRHSIR